MDENGQRRCGRGEWCSSSTVEFADGERVVSPALTYRPYCDSCERHIAGLLTGTPEDPASAMSALYRRLAAAIGDPVQADVWVPPPFGPQVPIREDIDAHMRVMAALTAGWAARVRAVARLASCESPHGSQERVAADCATLGAHVTVLLALQPGWTTRSFPMSRDDTPLPGEDWLPSGQMLPPRWRGDVISDNVLEDHADAEIIRAGVDYLHLPVLADGEDAGRELMHLHYLGRRLLMETNPPPEILLVPCRQCTRRALRRAWPAPGADRDLYSRCDFCRHEMTQDEYDVNARRWVAYHKANRDNRPRLGEPAAA
jgi:hypothetical protein